MIARKRKRVIDPKSRGLAIFAIRSAIEAVDEVEEVFIGTDFQWHRSRRFLTLAWAILEGKTVAELETEYPNG